MDLCLVKGQFEVSLLDSFRKRASSTASQHPRPQTRFQRRRRRLLTPSLSTRTRFDLRRRHLRVDATLQRSLRSRRGQRHRLQHRPGYVLDPRHWSPQTVVLTSHRAPQADYADSGDGAAALHVHRSGRISLHMHRRLCPPMNSLIDNC